LPGKRAVRGGWPFRLLEPSSHKWSAQPRIPNRPMACRAWIGRSRSCVPVADGPPGCRLTDLAASTALSKSTAHRILGALERAGLIEQDPQTRRFRPGVELYRLGLAAARRFDIRSLASPSLARLAERTGDTVLLSVPQRHEAICVAREVGTFPIKTLTLDVGDRRPLGVGAGSLALLAACPDPDVAASIAANAPVLAGFPGYDAKTLLRLVARTRRDGFAGNEGRIVAGMVAVGAAVLDRAKRPLAALSVAAITNRMDPARRRTIVRWLHEEARAIEANLIQE
jgi:DNA-binding IclR family transcriptional regulator